MTTHSKKVIIKQHNLNNKNMSFENPPEINHTPESKENQRVLEFFSILRAKKIEQGIETTQEQQKNTTTPEIIRKKVEEEMKKLSFIETLSAEQQQELQQLLENNLKEPYVDKRFDVINDKYLEFSMEEHIDNIVDIEEEEDIKSIMGLIVFDVNGLKAINDNIGRREGDLYLQKIFNVICNGETVKEMESMGVDIQPASAGGGDEFYLLVKSDKSQEVGLEKIALQVQQEVSRLDCQDLHVESFFSAGVSAGVVSFQEALSELTEKDYLQLNYKELVGEIRSKMFAAAHKKSHEDKKDMKRVMEDENPALHSFLQRYSE